MMRIRFQLTLLALLLAIAVIGIVLAIMIGRAERQRGAILTIEKHGGSVRYSSKSPFLGLAFSPSLNPRPHSLLQNLRHSITQVTITNFGYNDETHDAIQSLPYVETIYVYGHDSDYAFDVVRWDFPGLEIVNVQAELRKLVH